MTTDIAVLITCHNRREKTVFCLKALYGQELPAGVSLSVYLTDDGCTDGTVDVVKESFPNTHIIHGNGDLYWNRGMLAAWREAAKTRHDFYIWLNDDTFLKQNALANLLEDWENAPSHECIIVGATTSADGSEITYSGRISRGGIIPPNGTLQPCQEFNGNCVLIPGEVFQKLGMLDEYFRHSFGDSEYGMRANRHSIPCYVARGAIGTCEKHTSMPRWQQKKIPLIERFKHLYSPLGMSPVELFHINKKYNGLFTACCVFVLNHWHCLFP